jgi:hypothetical protein
MPSTAGDIIRNYRTCDIVAALATVYTLFLVYAAGLDHLMLSCILYAFSTRPARCST